MKKINKASKFFILTAIVIALSVMFSCVAFGADADVLKNYGANSKEAYCEYRWYIETINFVDNFDGIDADDVHETWELTENIKAWIRLADPANERATVEPGELRYDLYIGSLSKIKAPEDMSYFFAGFRNAEKINGLDKLDTSAVKDMRGMFADCAALKELDLSGVDTSNVTDMSYMFKGCGAMETLDVSDFNTEKVTLMNHMFSECYSIYELNLDSFNTKKVIDTQYMFSDCGNLHTIYVGNNWIFLSVKSSDRMFKNCYLLTGKTTYDPVKLDVTYASTEYYTVHSSVLDGVPVKFIFIDNLTVGDQKKAVNYTGYHYYSFIGSFESRDPDVVTVNDNGEFTAVGAGRAEIVTTLNNLDGEITFIFNVVQGEKIEVEVNGGILGDLLTLIKHWFQRIIDLFSGKLDIF